MYKNIISSYKTQYSIKDANSEINRINTFLNRYKNSIKKFELKLRVEEILYLKVKIYVGQSIESIKELNDILVNITEIKNMIVERKDYKGFIDEKIDELKNDRDKIFNVEWENKKQLLFSDMKAKARDYIFDNVHEICAEILNMSIIDSDNDEFINEAKYINIYDIQNKCGLWCGKICRTKIKVVGNIFGDENSGVNYYSNASLISDVKLN